MLRGGQDNAHVDVEQHALRDRPADTQHAQIDQGPGDQLVGRDGRWASWSRLPLGGFQLADPLLHGVDDQPNTRAALAGLLSSQAIAV